MILSIGSRVTWRGAWGSDPAEVARIEAIELYETEEMKGDFISVPRVFVKDLVRAILILDNDHWAYGYQIQLP